MAFDNKNLFPIAKKSISDFLYEEEANISRGKVLSIGSLMIIVSILFLADEVFAGHSSHSSHSSHKSHSSHSSHSSHASSSSPSHYSSSIGGSTIQPAPVPQPVIPETQIPQIPQDTPAID